METIEAQIENGLQILDQKEAELTELSQKFGGLTIAGLEDKEGFKKVREARITLKNARVGIEKSGKALRENALKFQKRVIEREKELVGIIEPVESKLEQEEDGYLYLQEQARIKKEREENERIQKRVDALAKFDYAVDLYEVKIMPEENFQALLGHAEAEYLKEQERIKEEQARLESERKAEEQRIAAEKKAEEERLALERAELQKQKAEQERIARDQQERENTLKAERERVEKEQQLREAAIKAEQERIDAERKKLEEEKRLEQVRKETEERVRREAKEKAEREARELEEREILAKRRAELEEALKPDKEKITALVGTFRSIEFPAMKTKEAQKVVDFMMEQVHDMTEQVKEMLIKL